MGRRLGQHFLRSKSIIDRIVAEAGLKEGEAVLEVGPGEGVLTERLLASGAHVTVIELDPHLCEKLLRRWGDEPRFRLVEGDVLKVDLSPEELFGQPDAYALIANLPYYLSSPLLFRLAARRKSINRMLLMVQKEIADRLVAGVSQGKAYGSLGIAAQLAFEMRQCFTVPPGAFSPPPKVDSAVVAFHPREVRLTQEQENRYQTHLKQLFSARRKVMLSTLKRQNPAEMEALTAAACNELEALVGRSRPDALSPDQHLQVFQILSSK